MVRGLGIAMLTTLVACSPGLSRSAVGAQCERNSQCAAPLVCRIGYCRNECANSLDCPAPLACVRDAQGLGACQIQKERDCAQDSACPAPLVCRDRQCVESCVGDRDCLGGARCLGEPGARACFDIVSVGCTTNAECAAAQSNTRCLASRCREECVQARDCHGYGVCNAGLCAPSGTIDGSVITGDASTRSDATLGIADGDVATDAARVDSGRRIRDGGRAPATTCGGGPLTGVIDFDVGLYGGCAIVEGPPRSVYCWGNRVLAGLTSGTAACATEHIGLRGTDAAAIRLYANTACILRPNGEVLCWGNNQLAQLGRGSMMPASDPMPMLVPGVVATGLTEGAGQHVCALRGTGMAPLCWGDNTYGELGDGTRTRALSPVAITAVAQASAMALGVDHSCVLDGGRVTCFGRAGEALGDASITDATAVVTGGGHFCALTPGGVLCWGENASGELGNDEMLLDDFGRRVPLPVRGLPDLPIAIDGGGAFTCALEPNGEVWCWGYTLGFGQDRFERGALPPTYVMSDVRVLRAGDTATCGLIEGGRLRCVGGPDGLDYDVDSAALGYGLSGAPHVPVEVQLR